MTRRPVTIDSAKIIERMNQFASNAKSDYLSVSVARVAQRLSRTGNTAETPLTDEELRVIKLFQRGRKAA